METIKTTTEIITPAKAVEYLTKNVCNRTINNKCVQVYADDMLHGRWMLNGEPIIFCKDGALYDGQHRLKACIKANVPFMSVVVRGIELDAFTTIDCGKPRSAADSLKIYGEANSTIAASILRKYIGLCSNFVTVAKADSSSGMPKISNQQVVDMYYKHKDLVNYICHESRLCYDSSKVLRASDIGGITLYLHIERKHPIDYVVDFFSQLCDRKPTEWGQIRYLRKILIDDSQKRYKMAQQARQAYIVKAWNYYVMKKDVGLFRLKPQFDFGKQFI